jgi:GTP cyclohydrolase I
MQHLYTELLSDIGENPSRSSLLQTPQRAYEVFKYLTQGYGQSFEDLVKDALFDSDMKEMVIVKNIELYSLCEHHLLPFFGKCHVGYIPNGKILGLSKIARIVDHFGRRLQVQERLTTEVAGAIESITNAQGVAVVIEAQHLCMMMRGIEKQNASMTTSVMLGDMRDSASSRAEFLQLIQSSK